MRYAIIPTEPYARSRETGGVHQSSAPGCWGCLLTPSPTGLCITHIAVDASGISLEDRAVDQRFPPPHPALSSNGGEDKGEGAYVCHHSIAYARFNKVHIDTPRWLP
jgi:hypothetical protein